MRAPTGILVLVLAIGTPVVSLRVNAAQSSAEIIDGVAARIDTDIITESEVRELGAFQALVDGKSRPRADLLRELENQWIVRGEAETSRYPRPSDADVDNTYAQLLKQFPSADEFAKRSAAAGLTQTSIRHQLEEQLYLSRFIGYRFRSSAQVDDAAVQKFYDEEFVPQLKARNEAVPTLASVQDTIREVLVQRAIDERSTQWLDDTRAHLRIEEIGEMKPAGGGA